MRNLWRRAQAWLRREAYVRAVVEGAVKQAYLDGHAAGVIIGNQYGYQVGRAHGHLEGRQALADELTVAHGVDGGGERAMTAEDVATLKVRQLH